MSENVRNILVRNGYDYAEFFVRETGPIPLDNGRTRYAATWCCVSSYGVYGHHWSDMGCPLVKFVAGAGNDYLLSKIARRVFDKDRFKKWLSREIFTARVDREAKSRAAAQLRSLCEDHDGEALAVLAFEDPAIAECEPEWCDADTRDWDPQAVMFVEKMWPKFVAELRRQAMAAGAGPGPEQWETDGGATLAEVA